MRDTPFSIDFDDLDDFLKHLFENDARAQSILAKSGFSNAQLDIIKILIIAALKGYDLQKQQSHSAPPNPTKPSNPNSDNAPNED